MALPVQPPVRPMLAKLRTELPVDEGWLYEPKWDGFRAVVFRDGHEVEIRSRDLRPLDRYFPELPDLFRASLPERCVVDGEIVVPVEGALDFDQLQQRIHPAESRVAKLAGETPAGFVAFDVLALDDADLRSRTTHERRIVLESLLPPAREPSEADGVPRALHAVVTPQTSNPAACEVWLGGIDRAGIEGVIAKRADEPYRENERSMVKVKQRKTIDCVVGGYRLSKAGDGVGSLLLGLYDSGVLHYVGHTSSFKAAERRELLARLKDLEGGSGFGPGRAPGGPSRWAAARGESPWVPLDPVLVCEVAYDKMQGERIRHAATFLRWRPEREPADCTFEQLGPGRG
ncbi:MAG TPA: ATP-dependent DNA ligase [Actinomycetota bacterium]|nr:ATP-dependent DNA ligase [Actinomycetota bacterium]